MKTSKSFDLCTIRILNRAWHVKTNKKFGKNRVFIYMYIQRLNYPSLYLREYVCEYLNFQK